MQQCVPDEGGMPAEQPQRAVDRRARIEQAVGWSAQQHDLPRSGRTCCCARRRTAVARLSPTGGRRAASRRRARAVLRARAAPRRGVTAAHRGQGRFPVAGCPTTSGSGVATTATSFAG